MNAFNRLLWRLFKIDQSNTDDRNAWLLVMELFWASILGSVATFNAAFAIRLGADNFQVSLLSSIPALMAVLVSYPTGHFLQRRPHRTPWVFGSLLIYRAGFLLVAAAPWLHLAGIKPGLLSVLILVLISAPGHFFNVGWFSMLAEVIPEQRRAAVFTARNIVNQVMVSVTVFLCGQWLSRVQFPINYTVMYVIGFTASMLSMYNLYKMHVPDSPVPELAPAQKRRSRSLRAMAETARETFADCPAFLRIMVNTLLHGFGIWMAAPLYALYFVRTLNASDAWLGLNGTLASIGTIAGFSLWRYLISRWGEPISLKRTIILLGIYPALVGLTPSLSMILVYGVINGLVSPGVSLSHFNTLLKVTPADARPRYTSYYMTLMNVGAFICPMISITLADRIGLAPMLVVAGVLSILGSTSFWWHPVLGKDVEKPQVVEAAAQ